MSTDDTCEQYWVPKQEWLKLYDVWCGTKDGEALYNYYYVQHPCSETTPLIEIVQKFNDEWRRTDG